ncbi:MAG: hypothetical protein AAF989_13815 [Planctomycetota bacterium]
MTDRTEPVALGFYTVVECERTGWTGGLLILNEMGRPLEFRCTLPVRPSKSHEILFGPTMRAHLIGDVIANVLLKSSRTPISMMCCQQAEALAMESLVDYPVCLVRSAAEDDEGPITRDMLSGSTAIDLAGSTLMVGMEKQSEAENICRSLVNLPDAVEPFDRIRDAISEAHSQLARAA